jgi:hypothetical protein
MSWVIAIRTVSRLLKVATPLLSISLAKKGDDLPTGGKSEMGFLATFAYAESDRVSGR